MRLALALAALASVMVSSVARADGVMSVVARPPYVRLGVDRAVELEIESADPNVSDLDVVPSAGTIGPITRGAPGHFSATYTPPDSRAPDLAVLLVRAHGDAHASVAVLPLWGRYHLLVDVEPFAHVTVSVANTEARETNAPANGHVELFIHVPPGTDTAQIVAVDRGGNRTVESQRLELPPTHRIVVVPAPPPAGAHHALGWLVAIADPTGQLATTAPEMTLTSGLPEVSPIAPGLFAVATHAVPRLEPYTITLAARAPDAIATPETIDGIVAAARPDRVELSSTEPLVAGTSFTVDVAVRTETGEPIAGLAPFLAGSLSPGGAVQVTPRGDLYRVAARAPERSGDSTLLVRFQHADAPIVSAEERVHVVPGPPVRIAVHAPALRIGTPTDVEIRGLDRFGNEAPIGHPTLTTRSARMLAVTTRENTTIRIVPRAQRLRIEVRGDYGLTDAVDLTAARPLVRPFAFGLETSLRWNLGALWLTGPRIAGAAQFPIATSVTFALVGETGIELGSESDAQGTRADVLTVPMFVRAAVLGRFGALQLGAIAGPGLRWTHVSVSGNGTDPRADQQLGLCASFGLLARIETPGGMPSLEVGGETGSLDSPVARGTLGGLDVLLGWSFAP